MNSNIVQEKEQKANKNEVKLGEGNNRRCQSININNPTSSINPWAKNRGNNTEYDLNKNRVRSNLGMESYISKDINNI